MEKGMLALLRVLKEIAGSLWGYGNLGRDFHRLEAKWPLYPLKSANFARIFLLLFKLEADYPPGVLA
jgi:hypothetical protein